MKSIIGRKWLYRRKCHIRKLGCSYKQSIKRTRLYSLLGIGAPLRCPANPAPLFICSFPDFPPIDILVRKTARRNLSCLYGRGRISVADWVLGQLSFSWYIVERDFYFRTGISIPPPTLMLDSLKGFLFNSLCYWKRSGGCRGIVIFTYILCAGKSGIKMRRKFAEIYRLHSILGENVY